MPRDDLRDELEDLFRAAAEDPSLGEARPQAKKGSGAPTKPSAASIRGGVPSEPKAPAVTKASTEEKRNAPPIPSQEPSRSSVSRGGRPAEIANEKTIPLPAAIAAPPSSIGTKRSAKPVKPLPQRKNLELIDYAPDEPMLDHRGRAKPLYKTKTPRPESWHPSKPVRLLLGLLPGARVMALESLSEGWAFSLLGVLTLLPALFMIVNWSATRNTIRMFSMDERVVLGHAAAIVALLFSYELLRLGSFLEERTNALKLPRVLATLTVPALAILFMGPDILPAWPRLVEALWCAALVAAMGGIAGSVWCIMDGTLSTPRATMIFRGLGAALLIALIAVGMMTGTFSASTLRMLACAAQEAGFRVLPRLL